MNVGSLKPQSKAVTEHFSAFQGRVPKKPRRGGGVAGWTCRLRGGAEPQDSEPAFHSPLLKNARGLHTPLYPMSFGEEQYLPTDVLCAGKGPAPGTAGTICKDRGPGESGQAPAMGTL